MFLDPRKSLCYFPRLLTMYPMMHRRSALKLIARARRNGKHVAPLASQIVPLVVLTALAGAVWVGLSIARAGLDGNEVANASAEIDATPVDTGLQPTPQAAIDARATVLAEREALVYISDDDERYFHASGHVGAGSRRAVSADSANCRGYVPCPVCCKHKKSGSRAVVNRN